MNYEEKSEVSLLTDDSDDASFIDDTSPNSPSRADECEVTKLKSNPKSSKYEVEESVRPVLYTSNFGRVECNR